LAENRVVTGFLFIGALERDWLPGDGRSQSQKRSSPLKNAVVAVTVGLSL
jgi:hypothetical protein